MKNSVRIISAIIALSLLLCVFALGACAASESYEVIGEEEEILGIEGIFTNISPTSARVLLIVVSVLLGLLLPSTPLTVFIVKLCKNRKNFEFVDYLILGISVIWLASGILLFAILL